VADFDPDAYLASGFDPDAYLSQSTPAPSPIAVQTPESGSSRFLPKSGAQSDVAETRQFVPNIPSLEQVKQEHPYLYGVGQGVAGMIPRSASDLVRMATLPRPSDVENQMQESEQLGKSWRGEYGPVQQAASITGTVLPLLPFASKLRLPTGESPIVGPRVMPDIEPSQSLGPGTTAGDVAAAMERLRQRELEQTLANIPMPQVRVSPETGETFYPGEGTVVPSETARFQPPPPIQIPPEDIPYALQKPSSGTILQRQPQEIGEAGGERGRVEPSVQGTETPETQVPQPSPETPEVGAAGTSNRLFQETYGEGQIPSGVGVDTGELLDNARAAVSSGAVDPYSVLSKTRSKGIANPQEYASLAVEHERLVNRAVALEKAGDPAAPDAAKQAEDFANAIQPHKTAASDLFRLMQGDLNYDLSTTFGIDQYMKSELGRGMKPSERPMFEKKAQDIRQAESQVPDAVARADAKVQRSYARIRDIPMEEAVNRIKQQLEPCL
jgi:hypothetical protein